MPDLQDSSVSRQGAANINVPTHQITGRLTDSSTGATLADFTGTNAITWPGVLATLTSEQQDEIAQNVANQLLFWKAGL